MLFASCTLFKKSVNQQRQDVNKSLLKFTDSLGYKTVDSSSHSLTTGWATINTERSYDKIIDEVIKDYGDSVFTVRTIKEKGQKRTEQVSHTSRYDSASAMITEHSHLQEIEQEDSSAVIITKNKDVDRTTLFPWWLWLILAGAVALGWWKRNPIIEFFKS